MDTKSASKRLLKINRSMEACCGSGVVNQRDILQPSCQFRGHGRGNCARFPIPTCLPDESHKHYHCQRFWQMEKRAKDEKQKNTKMKFSLSCKRWMEIVIDFAMLIWRSDFLCFSCELFFINSQRKMLKFLLIKHLKTVHMKAEKSGNVI